MKYDMIDNFCYVPKEKRHTSICPTFEDKQIMAKWFIRFLKEKKLYKVFINNYYNNEIGSAYREYLVKTRAMNFNIDNLDEYFKTIGWNVYLLNSFLWVKKDFWSDVHCEWLDYVKKQKNCGLL